MWGVYEYAWVCAGVRWYVRDAQAYVGVSAGVLVCIGPRGFVQVFAGFCRCVLVWVGVCVCGSVWVCTDVLLCAGV